MKDGRCSLSHHADVVKTIIKFAVCVRMSHRFLLRAEVNKLTLVRFSLHSGFILFTLDRHNEFAQFIQVLRHNDAH